MPVACFCCLLLLLCNGADDRTRTGDLLITNQLLYQLSYIGLWGQDAGGNRAGGHYIHGSRGVNGRVSYQLSAISFQLSAVTIIRAVSC